MVHHLARKTRRLERGVKGRPPEEEKRQAELILPRARQPVRVLYLRSCRLFFWKCYALPENSNAMPPSRGLLDPHIVPRRVTTIGPGLALPINRDVLHPSKERPLILTGARLHMAIRARLVILPSRPVFVSLTLVLMWSPRLSRLPPLSRRRNLQHIECPVACATATLVRINRGSLFPLRNRGILTIILRARGLLLHLTQGLLLPITHRELLL